MYKRLNKVIDVAWKKEVPLREIRQIEMSKEVVDWFLGLENSVVLTDEEVNELKKKRPKVSIKNNKPLNWQRTKYLFTLYVWTKVQENYLDKPHMHYLKQYYKRFKEDANLKASFNMQRERDLLFDLNYIYINYALGIDATFIKDNDVFKIPITDENKVVLKGEDLYKCGYWLEKQKMGSFVCQHCGKEIAYYTMSAREKARKYCKECSQKIHGNKTGAKKNEAKKTKRFCVDCGNECVIISNNDFKTCRCPECQESRNAKSKIKYKAKKREENNEQNT